MTTCLGIANPTAPLPVSISTVADYLGVSLNNDTQGEMTIKALVMAALDYSEAITGRDYVGKIYRTRMRTADQTVLRLRPTLDTANLAVSANGVPVPAGEIDVWASAGVLVFGRPLTGDVTIHWRTITPASLLPAEEAAVLLLAGHWWNRRDQGGVVTDAPYGVRDLLRSCAMPLAAMR